eukprot:TRINITY_DN21467_c1_g1_i1.p1 TRINITY_DN21467_c1_g1~~TRINITY_DN21467_c1_g1_i1.p1  ORF type:complete len:572 (+),score=61.78 TRINITY_DN21467_c1_g1_i1:90-1805(+)
MRLYDEGDWALGTIFQSQGSVVYKGCAWGVPCGLIAASLQITFRHLEIGPYGSPEEYQWLEDDWKGVMSTYSVAVSFLLVFRTQTAYSRFWDAISCLQQIRGSWVNVVSSCLAFCNTDDSKVEATETFKHQLVRLMSLLSCSALASVADGSRDQYQVLNMAGMEESSLVWLASQPNQCEIVLQWVQRLIIENHATGVLSAPAPILSRVFQELGNGITNLNNARRIELVPFPFPYAQMISLILCLHVIFTIVTCAFSFQSVVSAFCGCFMSSFVFWSVNYIAIEIERPYGEDANDLPLADLAAAINSALVNLLQSQAQKPPSYQLDFPIGASVMIWTTKSLRETGQGTESASMRLFSTSGRAAATVTPMTTDVADAEKQTNAELGNATLTRCFSSVAEDNCVIAQRLRIASQTSMVRMHSCLAFIEEDTGSEHLGVHEKIPAENQDDDTDKHSPLCSGDDYLGIDQRKCRDMEGDEQEGKTDVLTETKQTSDTPSVPRRITNGVEELTLPPSPFELPKDITEPEDSDLPYGPMASDGWNRPAQLEDDIDFSASAPLQPQQTVKPALIAGDLL